MKTTTENRVRRIIIHKSDPRYSTLRKLTLSSAKLWNVALDRTRSNYQVNGKTTPFGQLDKELVSENNDAYRALPAKVSKMVLMDYYAAMASFFELLARKRSGDSNEAVVSFSLDTKGHRLHIGEFDGYVSLGSMSVTRVRHSWMDDHVHTQFKHYILSTGEESLDFFMGDIRIDNGWEEQFNLQRQRAVVRILTEGVAP